MVLLIHGFSLSSLSFALFNPNESIAYILADAGEFAVVLWHFTRSCVAASRLSILPRSFVQHCLLSPLT